MTRCLLLVTLLGSLLTSACSRFEAPSLQPAFDPALIVPPKPNAADTDSTDGTQSQAIQSRL